MDKTSNRNIQIMELLADIAQSNAELAKPLWGTYFDYTAVMGDISYAYSEISNRFMPGTLYRVKQYGCQDLQAAAEVSRMLVFLARHIALQGGGLQISSTAMYTVEKAKSVIEDSARCPRSRSVPITSPWCERLSSGCDEGGFDPYAYDGTMTLEDYKRAQEAYFRDQERANEKPIVSEPIPDAEPDHR